MSKIYDVIILGAGPAGLTAGLYAGRSRLSTLIIEKGQDGGQIAITDEIENYPGQMVEGESGPSLIARMTEQAKKFGAERCSDTIKSVELTGEVKKLVGVKGEYLAWYCEDVTFERCRIIGTQPLCYCKGLKLIDCEMVDTDLAFERSEVEATVTTPVLSIKNPLSGRITVPAVGEIIRDIPQARGEVLVTQTGGPACA